MPWVVERTFACTTNTIYLSQEYLTQNATNPRAVTAMLLEQIGHYIDSRINTSDAFERQWSNR